MSKRPETSGFVQKELDNVEKQVSQVEESIKSMTMDKMNEAPRQETELKMSQKQINNSSDEHLKPIKYVGCKENFNEKFRDEYNFKNEYVRVVCQHNELRGDAIEKWSRPYPGLPAEFWRIPTNRPVSIPRYLAEEVKSCSYHRLVMDEKKVTDTAGGGTFYGAMQVDTIVQRLDAFPAAERKSIFMGASGF